MLCFWRGWGCPGYRKSLLFADFAVVLSFLAESGIFVLLYGIYIYYTQVLGFMKYRDNEIRNLSVE